MKITHQAVLPLGFLANGVSAKIKKSGKPDLALFYSQIPAAAAALFTTNSMPAAPVLISKEHLVKSKTHRAIIVNSGNANCFTGIQGLLDAASTTWALAKALKIKKQEVLVNSTGVIGKKLPPDRIADAVPGLVAGLSVRGIEKAAQAIMTTDTFRKAVTATFTIANKPVTICGVAKGAGMISPNMATMLVFILTDAAIAKPSLAKALDKAVDNSFNCITVDGCMSTNDSVMILANGASSCPVIQKGKHLEEFSKALQKVCLELAQLIVKDAEGATKFIRISVRNAKSFCEARKIGLAIANSALFKTAIYGENPNFGRIVAAVGSSGIPVREQDLKMKVSPLSKKEVDVEVSVSRGKESATIYTSDLTPEYIRINAEYN